MTQERPIVIALTDAYTGLTQLIASLAEEDGWAATPLPGWSVRDLIVHLLGDAQRALVALATPAPGPADRDAVTYWADFAPTTTTPETLQRSNRQIRVVRSLAVAHPWESLVEAYTETTAAACTLAARTRPHDLISTQGHTLTTDDFLSTLVVEAAVHHLDLTGTGTRPGPPASALHLVRKTLDGLLGHPEPVGWDDVTYAWTGTGRRALTDDETRTLKDDAGRFPLFS
ncbi:maleylpyruvate isomerase N-terminal domain-containing protein [Kineosporia sp. NBRC 101731]|uniref:maleylpyruvate isomerase N-terminal domain-containing protein n=1 Tax=Kineosporia sp. NBRC 101731 TaxID=3032199 RepID=UPI0024A16FDD|nr:maleylpyruvate isomerase N-terminal domain-containing protein [Kineosporia sp. NBRC 101731]GLY33024.1 maleylpyruvate isomerase [Kineosporia sp. NBRC 101731]